MWRCRGCQCEGEKLLNEGGSEGEVRSCSLWIVSSHMCPCVMVVLMASSVEQCYLYANCTVSRFPKWSFYICVVTLRSNYCIRLGMRASGLYCSHLSRILGFSLRITQWWRTWGWWGQMGMRGTGWKYLRTVLMRSFVVYAMKVCTGCFRGHRPSGNTAHLVQWHRGWCVYCIYSIARVLLLKLRALKWR